MEAKVIDLNSLVENKQYFSEGWNWYADKYLKQIVERSWLLILNVLSVIIFVIYILALQTFFPLVKSVPFVLYVDDVTDNFRIISKLSEDRKMSPQVAVAKYLVQYYVKTRESYDYNNLEWQKKYIKMNSSRAIYNDFVNYFDSTVNKDSPVLKYKRDGRLDVEIEDVIIYGTGGVNAKVDFIVNDSLNNTRKEHSVVLRFTLSNIVSVVSKVAPLEFRVVMYGR